MGNASYKAEIDGHTLEFRMSGTGSIDPWSGDYAHDNKIALMVTADCARFILVDGDHIYKEKGFGKLFHDCGIETWEQAQDWLDKYCYDKGSLKESLNNLAELKEKWGSKKEKQ